MSTPRPGLLLAALCAAAAGALSPRQQAALQEVHSVVPDRPVHDPLDVVVVVSHREYVLGCHTFERFLDPRWETYYVYQDVFAEHFRLRDTVELARDGRVSRGAHLVTTNRMAGELLARSLVLALLEDGERKGTPIPGVLLGSNCDIHEMPPWHPTHMRFQEVLAGLVRDFEKDSADRLSGRGSRAEVFTLGQMRPWNLMAGIPEDCLKRFSTSTHYPLLVMSQNMFETIPSSDSLKGAFLHGIDVGAYMKRGGREGYRPPFLEPGEPWLTDTSMWTEDHLVLFNTTLYRSFLPELSQVGDSIIESDRSIPAYLCRHKWAAVRHNSLPLFYDLSWESLYANPGNRSLYDPGVFSRLGVSHDWLCKENLRICAEKVSPVGCMREAMATTAALGSDKGSWCGFVPKHMPHEHIPTFPRGRARLRDVLDIVVPLLRLIGTVELNRTKEAITFAQMPLFHTRGVDVAEQGRLGFTVRKHAHRPFLWLVPRDDSRRLRVFYSGYMLGYRALPELRQLHEKQVPTWTVDLDARVARIGLPFMTGAHGRVMYRGGAATFRQTLCRVDKHIRRQVRRLDEEGSVDPGAVYQRQLAEAIQPMVQWCDSFNKLG